VRVVGVERLAQGRERIEGQPLGQYVGERAQDRPVLAGVARLEQVAGQDVAAAVAALAGLGGQPGSEPFRSPVLDYYPLRRAVSESKGSRLASTSESARRIAQSSRASPGGNAARSRSGPAPS
jgi:hypothetical protein